MSRHLSRCFTSTYRNLVSLRPEYTASRCRPNFGSRLYSTRISGGDNTPDLHQATTSSLLRAYFVYSALSFPSFIDASPAILRVATSLPIVRNIALYIVRKTFFDHFVGGDTFNDVVPLVQTLRARNLGCLIGYSVEVDEEDAKATDQSTKRAHSMEVPQYEKNIQEILTSIPLAGAVEDARDGNNPTTRKTWIAINLEIFSSTLVKRQAGLNTPFGIDMIYSPPSDSLMSESDIVDLKALHRSLKQIAELARKHQVRIVMDAEYSWYQPAIDALTTDLMKHGNSLDLPCPVNPVVYLTFQAYLRSTRNRLKNAIDHATSNGYILGVKLVRGAYHSHEVEHHSSSQSSANVLASVWLEKQETDSCYNECVGLLLDQVRHSVSNSNTSNLATIGLLFGTHNRESCDVILEGMVKRGLAILEQSDGGLSVLKVPYSISAQVQIGQLLGMADELTNYVSCHLQCPGAPMVLKYVPYGSLQEVMPYLARRAIENKSILGWSWVIWRSFGDPILLPSGPGGLTGEPSPLGRRMRRP